MKLKLTASIVILGLLITQFSSAQSKEDELNAAIYNEGVALYRSEMASWYGTDLFMAEYKEKWDLMGGYFSYSIGDTSKCIFYTKGDDPHVLVSIAFDLSYDLRSAIVEDKGRPLNEMEEILCEIRTKARDLTLTDDFYKWYENTRLNLIPIISNGERKVYIVTGPQVHNTIIFGNDYLLTFDSNNQLKTQKRLHANIIFQEYDHDVEQEYGMHTHLPSTGAYMTATDICTLMLYGRYTPWNQYYVISNEQVTTWNIRQGQSAKVEKENLDRKMKKAQKRIKSRN